MKISVVINLCLQKDSKIQMIFFFIIIINLLNLLFKFFDLFLTSLRHIFFFHKFSIILFLIQNLKFIFQLFFLFSFQDLLFLFDLLMKLTFKRRLIREPIFVNIISFNQIFQLSSTPHITYKMSLLITIFIFLIVSDRNLRSWYFSIFKLNMMFLFPRRCLLY